MCLKLLNISLLFAIRAFGDVLQAVDYMQLKVLLVNLLRTIEVKLHRLTSYRIALEETQIPSLQMCFLGGGLD
jgi:hypothetical protein